MRTIVFSRLAGVVFAVVAALMAASAFFLELVTSVDLGSYPVLTNAVSVLLLLPLEVLIVTVVVSKVVALREQGRWVDVSNELTDAIAAKWLQYSELVRSRFRQYGAERAEEKIYAAMAIWGPIHDQELDAFDRGEYWDGPSDFPPTAEKVLSEVPGVWFHMWGAGAEDSERAMSRRLVGTLLPRLLPNSPLVTKHVRALIDAIEDFNDFKEELSMMGDPFPSSPFMDDPENPGTNVSVYGLAINALDSLDRLLNLIRQADQVVAAGESLIALLPQTPRMKERRARQLVVQQRKHAKAETVDLAESRGWAYPGQATGAWVGSAYSIVCHDASGSAIGGFRDESGHSLNEWCADPNHTAGNPDLRQAKALNESAESWACVAGRVAGPTSTSHPP